MSGSDPVNKADKINPSLLQRRYKTDCSLEEQGAHCDGEGKGGSSAEQQGVQARSDEGAT